MVKCQLNKFWIQNPMILFCNHELLPLQGMNLIEQLNSLTRLVLLIFILFSLFNLKYSLIFLTISLLFIIILYYIQRNKMKENYTYSYGKKSLPTGKNVKVNLPTTYRFCNDEKSLDVNNTDYVSINQKLAGNANPKTLIPPVMVPRSHNLDYWKNNNLVTHSAVNEQTNFDAYNSGYQISTCCGSLIDKYQIPTKNISKPNLVENYEYTPYLKDIDDNYGHINNTCGYNSSQLQETNLPNNFISGNCQQEPSMKEYNKNIFTQTIQPGVYTNNEVIEPINSNIGISFTQQFQPVSCQTDKNENVLYTEHDPKIYKHKPVYSEHNPLNYANMYDPRFTGYGTSYRAYTDENIGQTRFYYDDIDAIRMPNYITRSKIDHEPFADSYGPLNNSRGNPYNSDIRALANNAFLDSSLEFRTGLQERLMRKNNAVRWQRRLAPINTSSGRML